MNAGPTALSFTQDAVEVDPESDEGASTTTRLVWALHALVDSNTVNQLSFQAAGGIQLLIRLLAQARLQAPSQAPPPPSSHPSSPTAASSTYLSPSHIQSQLERTISGGLLDSTVQSTDHREQPQLTTALVWLMGSAAADAPANQSALQQTGAVHLLLDHMQSGRVLGVVQGSMFALGNLVKGNTDIQSEVQAQVSRKQRQHPHPPAVSTV